MCAEPVVNYLFLLLFFCTTGEAITYSTWWKGEPSDTKGNENCVHANTFTGGRWNDLPCGETNIDVFCEILLPQGNTKKF